MSSTHGERGKPTKEEAESKNELDELQLKYRDLEKTLKKETSRKNAQSTIRMQMQQIEKLKKDNERLKEDLALETRQAKQANNMSASSQIAKLQDQGDLYIHKIKREKERIRRLDEQVLKMNKEILDQREAMGGINAFRKKNQSVQKNIRMLENQLDKALVKFNEALAHNTNLKGQIDNLRKDRQRHDIDHGKLEKELQDKKSKMDHIINIAKEAYKARDAAQAEMCNLKLQADKEQSSFEEEWKKLGNLIEEDRKNKEFLKEDSIGSKGDSKSKSEISESSMYADPALDEAKALRERNRRSNEAINKDVMNIQKSMLTVQKHEEAFAKIQKATKITDIDELVNTFINAEDKNFTLFNYVNDLTNEIEKLEDSIATIKAEIVKYKGNGQNADNERKKLLSELEAKLQKTDSKAVQYEDKYHEAMKTVNKLKEGIQSIFNKIGCANIVPPEMLGTAGVTESSMMQYLGVIELRTNELLKMFSQQQAKDANAVRDTDDEDGNNEDGALAAAARGERGDEKDEEGNDEEDPALMEEVAKRLGN